MSPDGQMETCPFCGRSFKRLKTHIAHCKMAPVTKATKTSDRLSGETPALRRSSTKEPGRPAGKREGQVGGAAGGLGEGAETRPNKKGPKARDVPPGSAAKVKVKVKVKAAEQRGGGAEGAESQRGAESRRGATFAPSVPPPKRPATAAAKPPVTPRAPEPPRGRGAVQFPCSPAGGAVAPSSLRDPWAARVQTVEGALHRPARVRTGVGEGVRTGVGEGVGEGVRTGVGEGVPGAELLSLRAWRGRAGAKTSVWEHIREGLSCRSPAPAPLSPAPAPLSPALAPLSPTPAPQSPAPAPLNPAPAPLSPALAPLSPTPAPQSPALTPLSPALAPLSPTLAPLSPTPAPQSPALTPAPQSPAPNPAPQSPAPAPLSPALAPLSPALAPLSPTLAPLSPALAPLSPTLAPLSPALTPLSPALAPLSPALAPLSPALAPQSPALAPQSPALTPLSPAPSLPTPASSQGRGILRPLGLEGVPALAAACEGIGLSMLPVRSLTHTEHVQQMAPPTQRPTPGSQGSLADRVLMEVRLAELPDWFCSRSLLTPRGAAAAVHRGWRRYYGKYIDVRRGGAAGVAMLLAGYCMLSYLWSYPHLKRERWRKYH